MKKTKKDKIKVYLCPRCKSKNVGYIFRLRNIFGIIPRMRCYDCGTELMMFPIIEVNLNKLKRMRKFKNQREM